MKICYGLYKGKKHGTEAMTIVAPPEVGSQKSLRASFAQNKAVYTVRMYPQSNRYSTIT